MDNDSSHTHQQAEGHHIAQASEGSIAVVASEGAQVTVTVQGENVRGKELAYLGGLLKCYEYWRDHYTPLAGIAEVRAAVEDGPRLDLPMAFIPPGFEKLVEHGYGERAEVRREPVDDLRAAVAEHRRVILLGDPGSGKTTTLWRLAYDYAQAAQADAQAPLPLLVPLGNYTDSGSFDAYLARHLGLLAPYLETYRASARLILLLDGLNEMPQAGYAERVGRIRDVLKRYPDEAVVVTCRALDYVVKLERLQEVEISPLDETRIRTFLHNCLGQTAGEDLFLAMSRDAKMTLREEPPLLALGRNPYMLLMTAQVYVGAGGELPSDRAQLFAAFVDTLLERERKRHPAKWIDAGRQKNGLAALAYAMQAEGERGTAVDREWALAHLCQAVPDCDAKRLLYLATSATLLDAPDVDNISVRFYHQLLQEYFTARYIVDGAASGTIPCLLAHCTDVRWREVILLTASLLDNADDLFVVFQCVLDEFICENETLVVFLDRAARKAAAVKADYKPVALRSYCCALDVDRDRTTDPDLIRVLICLRTLASALRLACALDRNLATAIDCDPAIDLNYDLDFALARVLTLARAFAPNVATDVSHNLTHAINRAIELTQQIGMRELHQALSVLTLPTVDSSLEEVEAFADALQTIMIEHRDIGHDWDFTREQTQRLERYFYAAELLVQCLDLTHVTDRAAIENRLLLPPGWDPAQGAEGQ